MWPDSADLLPQSSCRCGCVGGGPWQADRLVSLDQPPDRSLGDDLVDRARADALAKDFRVGGEVRTGRRRRWWLVPVAVVATLALYLVATLAQVVHTGRQHDAARTDAIIVMGAAQYDGRPSPQLAARLDHVVALWEQGVAPRVVVTGGNRPGDRFTEAEASARFLTERGVPDGAIVQVGEGATTYESVAAAAGPMRELGIESVALVTDPYHALRSRLIVEDEGFDVDVATTPESVVSGSSAVRRHLQEAAGVALGRLIGFDRLSDLTG